MASDDRFAKRAIRDHKVTGRWTLSVACVPGLTAEEIAERSEVIQGYNKMRVGRAGDLKTNGFPVELDGKRTHAVIVLPDQPRSETWTQLRELMPEKPNPFYRGDDGV